MNVNIKYINRKKNFKFKKSSRANASGAIRKDWNI